MKFVNIALLIGSTSAMLGEPSISNDETLTDEGPHHRLVYHAQVLGVDG